MTETFIYSPNSPSITPCFLNHADANCIPIDQILESILKFILIKTRFRFNGIPMLYHYTNIKYPAKYKQNNTYKIKCWFQNLLPRARHIEIQRLSVEWCISRCVLIGWIYHTQSAKSFQSQFLYASKRMKASAEMWGFKICFTNFKLNTFSSSKILILKVKSLA